MPQLQLEGNIDARNELIEQLQAENNRLQREVTLLRVELARAQNDSMRAVSNLRKILSPLYGALQQVFGEMETISLEEDIPSPANIKKSAVWESWKQKLGGKQAEFITVLLEHGEMSATQLRIATRSANQTVYDTVHKLNKAGLINKNGGKISLKHL